MSESPKKHLLLEEFLPYRLSYLSNMIGRRLANIYAKQFKISPSEWKVMALLNRFPNISAAEVAERTALDKVAVSRAVNSLLDKGHVRRHYAEEDRRRSILSLTNEGQDIYNRIEPLVTDYERLLLKTLNAEEQAQLDTLIRKLTQHAEKTVGE
ncbi:MarR family winged helix-turn-helix transcriptional regulator [Luteithermobacter gelatinilyticus]|uniref:MarR family winged helix-turn-helix transcriptional regulator n=1 Tax=Luteithermobacter gelatinilyticus TaxID=2582913 RepID=UPI00110649E4|nr:MarR family transcriptional regulator [Luteithermobacter gelatinilyticus]|tara:strand:- start:10802 stop:11263 length:462 start_codon:yes stop_codon:yes gene_type:complete